MFDEFLNKVLRHINKVGIVITGFATRDTEMKIVKKAEFMCRQSMYYAGTVESRRSADTKLCVTVALHKRTTEEEEGCILNAFRNLMCQ